MKQSLISKIRYGRANAADILGASIEELQELFDTGLTTVIRRISFSAPEINEAHLLVDLTEFRS